MPPKNRISVARKIHMPSVEASFCWATSSNWCRSARLWLANRHLLKRGIIIRFMRHYRSDSEILGWRRRTRLPLKARRVPRVIGRDLTVPQRPNEIDCRYQIAYRQHRSTSRRKDVINLELLGIRMIAPRHPQVSHDELWKKCQVESKEDHQRR